MSRSAFVTHPTLERMPGRPPRWPVVVGTAAAVLAVSAVFARPALPPPPGEPPQAVMRIPAWYLQPQPAAQLAQASAPSAARPAIASGKIQRAAARPHTRVARLDPTPRTGTAAPAEQSTAAGLEGLF